MTGRRHFPATSLLLLLRQNQAADAVKIRGFWLLTAHCCELRSLTKQFLQACIYSDKMSFRLFDGPKQLFDWWILLTDIYCLSFDNDLSFVFICFDCEPKSRFSFLVRLGRAAALVNRPYGWRGEKSFTAVEDNWWLAFKQFFRSTSFLLSDSNGKIIR